MASFHYVILIILLSSYEAVESYSKDSVEVDLVPFADEVLEGNNYIFNCTVSGNNITNINITFTILIDNSTDHGDVKVLRGPISEPDSQEFIIQNVSYTDNDAMLTCVVNSIYRSEDVPMTVYFAPKILSPVNIPIKLLNDSSFTITIQYICNPELHFVDWKRNGVVIHTGENFQIEYNNLTFENVLPTDNGTYTVNLTNDIGSTTTEFDMIVHYAPILSFPTVFGGFFNQPLTVNVSVLSNPLPSHIAWYRNGSPLKSSDKLIVKDNILKFTKFIPNNEANYTLMVTNSIGTGSTTIQLLGYKGPYFVEGDSNSSYPLLHESRSDVDFNLTCTVKSSIPPVQQLTITPSNGPNWYLVSDNTTSATLVFSKGNAKDNNRMFNCTAKTRDTTAVLVYDSYIGGVPDKAYVNVSYNDSNNRLVISLKLTDDSSVPATNILYYMKSVTKDNVSLDIPHPPLKGKSISFDKVIDKSYGSLRGAGTSHVILIYVSNEVGSVLAEKYSIKLPESTSKKSRAGAIVAGIIVPVAVISLIIVGVVTYCHYKRKKSRGGFVLLADGEDSNINQSSRTDVIT